MAAAGRLWNGGAEAEVADYLVAVETDHMGLADAPGVRPRAQRVVSALSDYVREVRASIEGGTSSLVDGDPNPP